MPQVLKRNIPLALGFEAVDDFDNLTLRRQEGGVTEAKAGRARPRAGDLVPCHDSHAHSLLRSGHAGLPSCEACFQNLRFHTIGVIQGMGIRFYPIFINSGAAGAKFAHTVKQLLEQDSVG